MKAHTIRRGLLGILVLTALVLILASCGHVRPIETEPEGGSSVVPGVSAATIPRPKPLESPPGFSPVALPVPEVPSFVLEEPPGVSVAALRRPDRIPTATLSLPVPIPMAAAPKVIPSYAMIQRALTDPIGLGFVPGASKALSAGRYEPPWRPSSAKDGERPGGPAMPPPVVRVARPWAFALTAVPIIPSAGPVAAPSIPRSEEPVRRPAGTIAAPPVFPAQMSPAGTVAAPPGGAPKTDQPASSSRAAEKKGAERAAGTTTPEPTASERAAGSTAPVASAAKRAAAAPTAPVASAAPVARQATAEAPRERPSSSTGATGSPLPELAEVGKVDREVLARRGDPVELSFEGEGWLFAAAGRGSGTEVGRGPEGLEFAGSSSGQGRTRFSFTARELGEYTLSFQLQDHQAGMLRNELVRLRVLDDEAFARELTGGAGVSTGAGEPEYPWRAGSSASPVGPPVSAPFIGEHPGSMGAAVSRADRFFELGEYELALESYLREYRAGDPYLNERIAESYTAIGDYGAAATYYRSNLRGPADYRDRAILGLVRSALALEDEQLVIDTIPALLAVDRVPVQTELLGLARYLHLRARSAMAMQLLREYARRYPSGSGMDETLYRMAQLYESENALRDLAAARAAYRRVYEEWPESPFSEPAYQRLQYLDRHFFDVR